MMPKSVMFPSNRLRSNNFAVMWIFLIFSNVLLKIEALECRSDEFRCLDQSRCIRLAYKCDDEEDCDDGSDEVSCDSHVLDNFLLVSVVRDQSSASYVRPQIYQVDLSGGGGEVKPLLATAPTIPASLTLDHEQKILYYIERKTESIISLSLHHLTNSSRVVYRDPTQNADLDGLALDSMTQRLYFCDGGTHPKVAEISLTSDNQIPRIIHSGANQKPKSIVVDEANKELYWTDWGSTAGIFAIGIEPGAQKRSLVVHNITLPNALAIDFKAEVMYWVDARLDTIEMANLDGQGRRVLIRERSHNDPHFYAMTISPQYLYICDWTAGNVQRFHLQNHVISSQMPTIAGKKTGIIYHNSTYNNTGRCRPERVNILSRLSTLTTSSALEPRHVSTDATPVTTADVSTTTTTKATTTSTTTAVTTTSTTVAAATTTSATTAAVTITTAVSTTATVTKNEKIDPVDKKLPDSMHLKSEEQTGPNGLPTETVTAIAISSFVIFIIILSLLAWYGVRKHRRAVEGNNLHAMHYRNSIPPLDGVCGETAENSYERLPDLEIHPVQATGNQDNDWCTALHEYDAIAAIGNGDKVKIIKYQENEYAETA